MSMRRVYKQINLDVGARLRACRERAHLTREAFAEQVGITPRFVADIECGRVGASLTTLKRACEVLGASADEILWGEASAAKSAGNIWLPCWPVWTRSCCPSWKRASARRCGSLRRPKSRNALNLHIQQKRTTPIGVVLLAEKEGFELVEIGFCALPANASQYLYVLQIQDFLKRKFYWMSMRVDRFYRGKGHFCGQIQVKDMCLRFSDCKTGNPCRYISRQSNTRLPGNV